jgi:hypothetical protein
VFVPFLASGRRGRKRCAPRSLLREREPLSGAFWGCQRRDSNPRHADYDRWNEAWVWLSRAKLGQARSGCRGLFLAGWGLGSGLRVVERRPRHTLRPGPIGRTPLRSDSSGRPRLIDCGSTGSRNQRASASWRATRSPDSRVKRVQKSSPRRNRLTLRRGTRCSAFSRVSIAAST